MSKFANLFRIAYHGGDFHGSQIQPDVVTVEGVVKNILKRKAAATPQAMIFFLFSGAKLAAIKPIMIALSAAITISISII